MRSLIIRFIENRARKKLESNAQVKIASTAKGHFRRVRYREGCSLAIGEGSIVEGALVFERTGGSIVIGNNTFVGTSDFSCACRIEVGDDVLISWGCTIVDHNSHAIGWSQRRDDVRDWYRGMKDWANIQTAPVKIGNKAWVGLNVIILKGVEIGEGAVVAAGAVVVKSIPSWTVAGGNPAKVIREIPADER